MPRISTDNYDTVASWNGSQDLFVVEQPDGTKVATPAMVKQFIEAGNFTATGEVKDGHGNILKDMAKSANVDEVIGDLSQTGVTGASVAAQIATLKGSIKGVIVDTVKLSDNIPSINANSYEQYTISAIKAGYIPIAVVGVSYTGGVGVDVARFYVSGTDAVLLLHNVTSSTYTPTTLTAHVLYVEA